MMNEFEVPAYVTGRLPQLKTKDSNIYQTIQALTDYTKRMALEHNFQEIKKCMTVVEKIYKKGAPLVKLAIENVFIFSFSSMRMLCNIVEWRIVQSYMPEELYMVYIHQVLGSKD